MIAEYDTWHYLTLVRRLSVLLNQRHILANEVTDDVMSPTTLWWWTYGKEIKQIMYLLQSAKTL
jgi:hypothetical protein